MWRPAVIFLVAVLLFSAGCIHLPIKEPTVTVDGIGIERVTLGRTDLSLRLVVDNPNPIGATMARVSFDIYFLEGGRAVYLAHGEQEEIEIQPNGKTSVTIPVTADNAPLVRAFLRGLQDGAIVLRANGSATLDYGIATFEVPFNRTVEVRPEQG
ncbi:LEA type 2 family protein [Methanoculleus caldifontis]|nr:LEA type 2 family protein [Methanoculleus sp. Wushi-C6]